MQTLCVLFALVLGFGLVSAVRPDDEIQLVEFNESLYIANETYNFVLVPQFQVPVQLNRHVIYTATSQTVNQGIKRALHQNKLNLYELAPEDHEHLSNYMQSELPSFVKVNRKKRSLPTNELGFGVIPLARNVVVLHKGLVSQKRNGVQLGTTLCLHIPFFTTCDNSQDLTDVKNALQAQANEFDTELDSYEATNNKRANEMAVTLDTQRNLLQNLTQQISVTRSFILTLANAAAINAAQISHGDFIIHAQTDYLKRVSNSLLTFSSALASTDPRSLVAQPSLSKLFEGYQTVLGYLRNQSFLPILDSRTFNWTESILPTQALNNIVNPTAPYVSTATQIALSFGFRAVTTMSCGTSDTSSTNNYCTNPVPGTLAMRDARNYGGDQWLFGAFHQSHIGIYPLVGNATEIVNTTAFLPVVWTDGTPPAATPVPTGTSQLYCVDFLGFKSLATFQTTPNMLNGITPNSTASPFSDCNAYLFRDTQVSAKHYFLFGIREGIVVPFYSNCNASQLINETGTTLPIGHMINYPSTAQTIRTDLGAINNSYIYTNYEINAHHFISANCYMNMDPSWLNLAYYIPDSTTVISNVPRGYKINQFTINPAGELSSSLEFLYTNQWAWAYEIRRVSSNQIIVDEVNVLNGKLVLFSLQGNQVVDESDSFYGEGNNGRDCIHARSTYDYDLLSCYFQNNQESYSADQYLAGSITTTGIARFVNKFTFSVAPWSTTTTDGTPVQSYQFTLVPKPDADFSYSVQSQACPTLVTANSTVQGCQYQFLYQGNKTITFDSTIVTFDPKTSLSAIQNVSFTDPNPLRTVYAAGKTCMVLQCSYGGTTDTSTVRVETPVVQIVTADDKALVGNVDFAIDETLNSTIASMVQVQTQIVETQQNLSFIIQALGTLDFNVTRLVPYEDFTELRNQVAALVDSLQPSGSRACAQGVFGAAGCWANDALSIVVTVVIVVAILIILYAVCFKAGLAKKLFGKCGNKY